MDNYLPRICNIVTYTSGQYKYAVITVLQPDVANDSDIFFLTSVEAASCIYNQSDIQCPFVTIRNDFDIFYVEVCYSSLRPPSLLHCRSRLLPNRHQVICLTYVFPVSNESDTNTADSHIQAVMLAAVSLVLEYFASNNKTLFLEYKQKYSCIFNRKNNIRTA